MSSFFFLPSIVVFLTTAALAQTVPTPSPAPILLPIPAVDTPGATWIPAAVGNFAPANRPVDEPIDMVILHDIEGPSEAGISIFAREGAKVSAHYIVGEAGQITQMVRERDVAYHAGNSPINHRAVGIEMAGFAYRPGFYNAIELEAVAKLVRDVTTRNAIPRDRAHIIGHAEVPNPRDPTRFGGISGHTDPGPYWNWNRFMAQLRHDAQLLSAEIPTTIRPGEVLRAAVTFQNNGDEVWPANLAPNPLVGLQASGPVVYLGTSNGAPSQFSSLEGWISPSLAAGALSAGAPRDILPGEVARFEFSLRGPRQLGEIQEKLRLSTQPTAVQAQLPLFFGEMLPIPLRVVPWSIEMSPTIPTASAIATWRASLPLGGWWAIYTAPPALQKRSKGSLRYSVSDGVEVKRLLVEVKKGDKGWRFAGFSKVSETLNSNPSLAVNLDVAPRGVSASNAGVVRLVGPFEIPSPDFLKNTP